MKILIIIMYILVYLLTGIVVWIGWYKMACKYQFNKMKALIILLWPIIILLLVVIVLFLIMPDAIRKITEDE